MEQPALEEPREQQCDFCLQPATLTVELYPSAIIRGPNLIEQLAADWHLCAKCNRVVQQKDKSRLMARTIATFLKSNPGADPILARRWTRAVHEMFWELLDRRASGDWTPDVKEVTVYDDED